jgi:hypothetical protein
MTDDMSRQAATSPDSDHSLTIEEAAERYERAGYPRTDRSIQRYCAKGDLDCRRMETPFGVKYMITPVSVSRHIAYIDEVRQAAPSRDVSRLVAATAPRKEEMSEGRDTTSTGPDVPRPVAADERYVELLEKQNTFLTGQITAKDAQLVAKDQQIAAFLERDHETNALIQGLQRMLGLPAPSGDDAKRG